MIDHVWTVICSRAIIDKDSNNVSIQNVLEQVTVGIEPMPETLIPMSFEVITLWARGDPSKPIRGRMRLTFLFPSGQAFEEPVEAEINLSRTERQRQIFRFPGLPVTEPGRHIIRIECLEEGESEWHEVARTPLRLIFKPPEEMQVTNTSKQEIRVG
jgi:hypothetical protein